MVVENKFVGFNSLAELALDLHWSWNHGTDEVWRQLDPVLWELTRHPYAVLQTQSVCTLPAQTRTRGEVMIDTTAWPDLED